MTRLKWMPLLLIFMLATVLSVAGGCQGEAVTAEPSITPEPEKPQIVSLDIADPTPTVVPSTPEATPTPGPTPVPFSYYAPTVDMTYEELVGSTDDMSKNGKELLAAGYPDPKTYYIIVDKQWQLVLVYKRIDDGSKFGKPDYDQPVRYMLCSSGNPNREYGHDTTSGIWAIEPAKERFYQFVNLEAAQYLTLIHSRTYFHSILYDKARDLSTLIKESYDDLGTKASHACIRLTVPDSRWIWYNIGYGTTCEIRDGSKDDAVTAAIRAQLILPASKSGVRLKAGETPWTDNWTIDGVEHVLEFKYMAPRKPDLGDGDDSTDGSLDGTTTDGGSTTTPGTGGGGTGSGGTDGSLVIG